MTREMGLTPCNGSLKILVKQRDGLVCVPLDCVEYVSYRDRVLTFVLSGGREVRSRSLKEPFAKVVEAVLSGKQFVRPHESYVVNMNYANAMTATDFEMRSGVRVPISKRVYQRIREAYVQYVVDGDATRIV